MDEGREGVPKALGFPRFPPPAISTAGLAGRMVLPLSATSALANLRRLSYPHETAKNPYNSRLPSFWLSGQAEPLSPG